MTEEILTYEGLAAYDRLIKNHIGKEDRKVKEACVKYVDAFSTEELSAIIAEAESEFYNNQ